MAEDGDRGVNNSCIRLPTRNIHQIQYVNCANKKLNQLNTYVIDCSIRMLIE